MTCILCRTMQHVIFSQTICHLNNYDMLVHFQHGFNTVEDLSHRLDKRKTTVLLILKFSKAFDTVPHRSLFLKLNHYDITRKDQQVDLTMVVPSSTDRSPRRGNLHRFSRPLRSSTRHSVVTVDVHDVLITLETKYIFPDNNQAVR